MPRELVRASLARRGGAGGGRRGKRGGGLPRDCLDPRPRRALVPALHDDRRHGGCIAAGADRAGHGSASPRERDGDAHVAHDDARQFPPFARCVREE